MSKKLLDLDGYTSEYDLLLLIKKAIGEPIDKGENSYLRYSGYLIIETIEEAK